MNEPKHKILSDYFKRIGRKGGKAGRGRAKARSSSQARRAVQARWDKIRSASEKTT